MTSYNADERSRALTASIVADVLESHPLPTTVDELAPSDRRRLEDAAHELGITPTALLHRRRAEQTREIAEARELAALSKFRS
ncbi:hypothetical protein [Rathayibacter sp. VKM Ac-2801]|uniref:hypothetical protein n=1 Tax=Rathayibacter sp. VKM Ac-2801 TaxID=2609255 RepID=UPI0013204C82|nr:hypothetical protein [Rathayibacter sp. VKM Ac-2801]QHC70308.1 hypothetical protein GSU45_07940 [Rathayibacter sp. VKM Ac-2801]